MVPVTQLTLADFAMRRPAHQIEQTRALEWLTHMHVASEATKGTQLRELTALRRRTHRILERCARGAGAVGFRGHAVPDVGRTDWEEMSIYDLRRQARGEDIGARFRLFDEVVSAYFDAAYQAEHEPPADIIHVTCTGYVAPSGAQKLVAQRGWGLHTRVTHAYHMGCYAALPALRLAAGCLSTQAPRASSVAARRVDIVHTELCSLHLDPSEHSAQQLAIQSLFGDGLIRYSAYDSDRRPGLRWVAQHEVLLPDSADAMSWTATHAGMQMTLTRDVPERIAGSLREFVSELYARADLNGPDCVRRAIFAVHPGGPRIIDAVCDLLELDDWQVADSRSVLFDHGNMSSATLPHVWMRLVQRGNIRPGTPLVSLAFGPGLTVCGAVFFRT